MYYSSKKLLKDEAIDTKECQDAFYRHPASLKDYLSALIVEDFYNKIGQNLFLLFVFGLLAMRQGYVHILVLLIIGLGVKIYVLAKYVQLYKNATYKLPDSINGISVDGEGINCLMGRVDSLFIRYSRYQWDNVKCVRTFKNMVIVTQKHHDPSLVLSMDNVDEGVKNVLGLWKRALVGEPVTLPIIYQGAEMVALDKSLDRMFLASESDMTEEEKEDKSFVYHEIVSEDIHLDIMVYMPTEHRPYYKLCTSGLGAYRMPLSEEDIDDRVPERAELMMYLPADWKMMLGDDDGDVFQDENNYWPIRLLKDFARMPLIDGSWIGYGHTVSHEDGEPLAGNVGFSAAILGFPPEDFCVTNLPTGKSVMHYLVVPITAEELQFKLDSDDGADGLFQKIGLFWELFDTEVGTDEFMIQRYLNRLGEKGV
uniref:Suppressor of fused-like domain-containing protein n=1 Tax=Prevotella sp. GTC17260 TaxID=3236796 RepID=A0AB33J756_9BACT